MFDNIGLFVTYKNTKCRPHYLNSPSEFAAFIYMSLCVTKAVLDYWTSNESVRGGENSPSLAQQKYYGIENYTIHISVFPNRYIVLQWDKRDFYWAPYDKFSSRTFFRHPAEGWELQIRRKTNGKGWFNFSTEWYLTWLNSPNRIVLLQWNGSSTSSCTDKVFEILNINVLLDRLRR